MNADTQLVRILRQQPDYQCDNASFLMALVCSMLHTSELRRNARQRCQTCAIHMCKYRLHSAHARVMFGVINAIIRYYRQTTIRAYAVISQLAMSLINKQTLQNLVFLSNRPFVPLFAEDVSIFDFGFFFVFVFVVKWHNLLTMDRMTAMNNSASQAVQFCLFVCFLPLIFLSCIYIRWLILSNITILKKNIACVHVLVNVLKKKLNH